MRLGFQDTTGKDVVIELAGQSITRVALVDKGIPKYSPLEGLKFSLAGIIKKFPDLEGVPPKQAKREAVRRLREHLAGLGSQQDCIDYIVKDLARYGYKFILVQRPGHRPRRVKP